MFMARRRGFLAEMQRQARLADQRQRAAERQRAAYARQLEAAHRAAERASAAAARASEADRKRLEKEALAAHIEEMQAEVDQLNADLRERYEDVDRILTATLEIDDFVDLETLRVRVEHPPFPREDLRAPLSPPAPLPEPPHPVRGTPVVAAGLFGKKRKLAEAQAAVEHQYAQDYYAWKAAADDLPRRREEQARQFAEAEQTRKVQLAQFTKLYEEDCAAREAEALDQNSQLDELIAGLGYGTVDAVQEYVAIVLANSVYPEWFDVSHESSFEPATAELTLRVRIPAPDEIPAVKAYRYVKASDEIAESTLAQRDQKERYAGLVNNVALRSLHEVFEADRRGLIRSISLDVGTDAINPATGRPGYVAFAAVAAARDSFLEIDLSGVTPSATLDHLGAVVSKNPLALSGIDTAGVRRV